MTFLRSKISISSSATGLVSFSVLPLLVILLLWSPRLATSAGTASSSSTTRITTATRTNIITVGFCGNAKRFQQQRVQHQMKRSTYTNYRIGMLLITKPAAMTHSTIKPDSVTTRSNTARKFFGWNVNANKHSVKPQSSTLLHLTTTPSANSIGGRGSSSLDVDDIQSTLYKWSEQCNIRIAASFLRIMRGTSTTNNKNRKIEIMDDDGLGWYCAPGREIPRGSVLVSVPSNVALSVISDSTKPSSSTSSSSLPWFVQMSLQLNELRQRRRRNSSSIIDTQGSNNQSNNDNSIDYGPWVDSLPTLFDTPIHWSTNTLLDNLQYKYLSESIKRQEKSWKQLYNQVLSTHSSSLLTYDDFLWGCEIARSRSFSSPYSVGSTGYNPAIYTFVLFLATLYVGLNFGTIEQAANGVGVVVSVTILKDFVIPKLFYKNQKRYVICPMIDVANHKSVGYQGEVSFEYFSNSYSLATTATGPNSSSSSTISSSEQVYISYGPRSNDQLLQYYGFVEVDNPHDVYVMDPIREWDIAALEKACGRTVSPGRLALLAETGLLDGFSSLVSATSTESSKADDNDYDDDVDVSLTENGNDNILATTVRRGGVILTQLHGIDPVAMQALRVLVSTDDEWDVAMKSGLGIGYFTEINSGGLENEKCTKLAAKSAIVMELKSKPTTIDEDRRILRELLQPSETKNTGTALSTVDRQTILALQFRIEKKKLLQKCIDALE